MCSERVMSPEVASVSLSCPVPFASTDRILLGHGSGGKMTAELLARCFLPAFRNEYLDRRDDQAVVTVGGARLAFTTDSYVVTPLFFPGGDIGALAVNGTVNDLAAGGARPLYLSAAFILEEGFALSDLERIVASMRAAAEGGRRVPCHGRHESRRPRQGRRLLHHLPRVSGWWNIPA
jgi:hydrogenase expression/formation protein HypE